MGVFSNKTAPAGAEDETESKALELLGIKGSMLDLRLREHLLLANATTYRFEDEVRFWIMPLCRKELRGLEWKQMTMTLRVQKNPRKYDVIDNGDAAGERHLFENNCEDETFRWLKAMIEEYQRA